MGRSDFGLDYGGFRVGWVVSFCVDFVEVCPKGSVEWKWVKMGDFGCNWVVSSLILWRVSRVELLDTIERL